MVTGLWYTHDLNFGSPSWCWLCKEHPCPLSPNLGLLRMLELPDWGLGSWPWFGYDQWSLIHQWSKCWIVILILKVERTLMSFKSFFMALEDAECSWLGFRILIFIWIWSLVLEWALAFVLGYSIWFWLWFVLSRGKKICCLGWVGSGSGGFGIWQGKAND